jgi:hypothetical protein
VSDELLQGYMEALGATDEQIEALWMTISEKKQKGLAQIVYANGEMSK